MYSIMNCVGAEVKPQETTKQDLAPESFVRLEFKSDAKSNSTVVVCLSRDASGELLRQLATIHATTRNWK